MRALALFYLIGLLFFAAATAPAGEWDWITPEFNGNVTEQELADILKGQQEEAKRLHQGRPEFNFPCRVPPMEPMSEGLSQSLWQSEKSEARAMDQHFQNSVIVSVVPEYASDAAELQMLIVLVTRTSPKAQKHNCLSERSVARYLIGGFMPHQNALGERYPKDHPLAQWNTLKELRDLFFTREREFFQGVLSESVLNVQFFDQEKGVMAEYQNAELALGLKTDCFERSQDACDKAFPFSQMPVYRHWENAVDAPEHQGPSEPPPPAATNAPGQAL